MGVTSAMNRSRISASLGIFLEGSRVGVKVRMKIRLTQLHRPFLFALHGCVCALLIADSAWAGGGMVLRDDVCIIEIGFYDAHFTAYQPQTRGNEQFCQTLPDVGETLFVLDYLHGSMKEVPIDFRIIKDVTRLGKYVKMTDIEKIEDIDTLTVFYHPPTVHADASLSVDHTFSRPGNYIGVVTAGHPTKNIIYSAVFPFSVAKTNYTRLLLFALLALLLLSLSVYVVRRRRARQR